MDLCLRFGKDHYVPPIGARERGRFEPGDFPIRSNQDGGKIPPVRTTLYFPLPGNLTGCELLYLAQPAAELSWPSR